MKVAITGANGFLGKYLVEACLESGYEVQAFVRSSAQTSHIASHKNLRITPINYDRLPEELTRIKAEEGPADYLIHNAGKTTSIKLQDYEEINAGLTKRLVEAIDSAEFITQKLIYISSYTAQGPVGVNQPVSAYGASKLKAEGHIQQSRYPTLIFRPTAIYGAGDAAFLPLFKGAKKGVYPMVEAEQKMTMIHAADMATSVTHYMQDTTGIIHVNDGKTYSHEEFVKILSEVIGKKIRILKIPIWISKLSLGLSDLWCRISGASTNLTLEKFQEISMDWDLHNDENLKHSEAPIAFDLQKGFENAYHYYTNNKLL